MNTLTYRMEKLAALAAALTERQEAERRALEPFVSVSFPSLQVDEVRLDFYPNGTAHARADRERMSVDTAGALEWLLAHPGIRAQLDMFPCAEWRYAYMLYSKEYREEPLTAAERDRLADAMRATAPMIAQLYAGQDGETVQAALEELAMWPQIMRNF